MKPTEIYRGLDRWVHRLQGRRQARHLSLEDLERQAQEIRRLSLGLANLSDEEMVKKVEEQRDAVLRHKLTGSDSMKAPLACISEQCFRVTGRRPYVVQLMGSMALAKGYAIEMATGEGKTITASLGAVLGSWKGDLVHVVTSNDYLASRDAKELSPFYASCGLSVGHVVSEDDPERRRHAYACHITYATGSQLLSDHLKDRLLLDTPVGSIREKIHLLGNQQADQRVMKGLETVIVDEADSVLVDDATTPLLISLPVSDPELQRASTVAKQMAEGLEEGLDYQVFSRSRTIRLSAKGDLKIAQASDSFPETWRETARCRFLVRQALSAVHFHHLDQDYIIQDGEVVIVDEKTGRLMPNRSWSHGLHQAVEAKEGLEFSHPTKTSVKMSFQNFFRQYRHRSGMSGTFHGVRQELWEIYGLPIVQIPRRLPSRHMLYPDRLFPSQTDKASAIVEEVLRVSDRPVLIGVRSIKDSLVLSQRLNEEGIDHLVLNANRLDDEAEIISRAGQKGQVTIATNMAGRGTDIKLDDEVDEMGGLHVIATERHESRRVDLQLFGRASRQGQRGSGAAFLSLEDDLLQKHLGPKYQPFMKNLLSWPQGSRALGVIYNLLQSLSELRSSNLRFRILTKDMDYQELMSFAKH